MDHTEVLNKILSLSEQFTDEEGNGVVWLDGDLREFKITFRHIPHPYPNPVSSTDTPHFDGECRYEILGFETEEFVPA